MKKKPRKPRGFHFQNIYTGIDIDNDGPLVYVGGPYMTWDHAQIHFRSYKQLRKLADWFTRAADWIEYKESR